MFSDNLWCRPPSNLTISQGDTHIWRASLDQPSLHIRHFQEILSPDECKRAERFYFESDRMSFVISRGILRIILAIYLDIDPSKLQFCYGNFGKPALTKPFNVIPLNFNLSHSNKIVVYAITLNSNIGIDVEYIRQIQLMEDIVRRIFSYHEQRLFFSLSSNKKLEMFYRLWTRKEAFGKAIGTGLSFPFPQEDEVLLKCKSSLKKYANWYLCRFNPSLNYVGTVVTKKKRSTIKYWQWTE